MKKVLLITLVSIATASFTEQKRPPAFEVAAVNFKDFMFTKLNLLAKSLTHQDSVNIINAIQSEADSFNNTWDVPAEMENARFPIHYSPGVACATQCAINYLQCKKNAGNNGGQLTDCLWHFTFCTEYTCGINSPY